MVDTRAADEVKAAVQAMWASVAPAWGAHADEGDRRAAAITEHLLRLADPTEGDRVLELASGAGGAGLAAASLVGAAGEVVISDAVPAMVEIAARRAAERGLTNVRTKTLDLEDIAEP